MSLLDDPVPIEADGHVLRARRTAAMTRMAVGAAGAVVTLAQPRLLPSPHVALVGFVMIAMTALVHLAAPRLSWLSVEESLSALAGVLIVGLGSEHVTVLSVLWLVAVASGVLARGGRVHWLGRDIVLVALCLPVLIHWRLSVEYGAFVAGTIGLLLTSGRLTRELNLLLRQARLQAESAETLLLAGDIAARMGERDERAAAAASPVPAPAPAAGARLTLEEQRDARRALASLIAGEGLSMMAQPIVDIRSGRLHAYEALARFGEGGQGGGPLRWFSLADELGRRAELELACLRQALALFAARPAGTLLSVNLSAPVLLDGAALAMLDEAAASRRDGLDGLIVEITEETLVHSDVQLQGAIEPLRARGVQLAVDDMGAGYSGLRQITSVRPRYLKLDRSLISGIDGDAERSALVGALAGYARQVRSLLVAEGVETAAELAVVRRLGVPLVQGYLLGRPAPPWSQPLLAELAAAGELAGEELRARALTGSPERESEKAEKVLQVA